MNLFIIGSGFTKSIFKDAPLNNELLAALSAGKKTSASATLNLKYQTNDIEIALTKLDADLATTYYENKDIYNKLSKLKRDVQIELGDFFQKYRATYEILDEYPWLRAFMESTLSEGDVAVSLNYDSVFEGTLDCIGKWSPKGGYGYFQNPLIDDRDYPKSSVVVLKLHGSTTFGIAECADKPECKSVNFLFNELYFPKSAKNTHFRYGLGKGETYLIAPSYIKIPTVEITYLMIDALKAAAESQNLIIVGCGLRPEDSFLTLLMTHFLRQQQWQDRKIIIVDLKANNIATRIENYWGVNIKSCLVPIEESIEKSLESLLQVIRK